MKIGFGYNGLTRNFDKTTNTHLVDMEFEHLVVNVARNNPNDEFYLLSKMKIDTKNKKMFPHQNVYYEFSKEDGFLSNPKMDFVVLYSGIFAATCNIPNTIINKKNNGFKSTLNSFANCVGHTLKYLNKYRPPYIVFSSDPRGSNIMPQDLLYRPIAHYAQSSYKYNYKHLVSYDSHDMVIGQAKANYYKIEQIRLLDAYNKIPPKFNEKKTLFGLICNGGRECSTSQNIQLRYPIIEEYLNNIDCEIYGKWPNEYMEKDSRIKGKISYGEIAKKVKDWKYSLCIPIQAGWATGKYIEMIDYGIIPFLHPSYDNQRNVKNFPEYLRLNNGLELLEKINFIEKNPSLYDELWEQLYKCALEPDWISGKQINEFIYGHISKNYKFNYIQSTVSNWDDYF